jgi:phasin family protein
MVKKPEAIPGMDFDITKVFADFKVPGVDVDSVIASQRKNIEALANANRLAFEGVQAVMKRQMEIMRQSVEEAVGVARSMTEVTSPQDKAAKQAEMVKDTFERNLSNMRELVEMMSKSNNEAFDLLNKRFTQTMDEMKEAIVKSRK